MMGTTDNHENKKNLDDRKKRRKEEKEKLLKEVGHLIFTRYIDGNFNQFIKKKGLKPYNEKVRRLIDESVAQVQKVHNELVEMQNEMEKDSKKHSLGNCWIREGTKKKPVELLCFNDVDITGNEDPETWPLQTVTIRHSTGETVDHPIYRVICIGDNLRPSKKRKKNKNESQLQSQIQDNMSGSDCSAYEKDTV